MDRSRNAVGALEVAQAGNELTALSVKQALALQGLLAAQHRAETTDKRARSRHRGGGAPALQDLPRQRQRVYGKPPSAGAMDAEIVRRNASRRSELTSAPDESPRRRHLPRRRSFACAHGGKHMDDLAIIDRFTETFSRYIDSGFGLLAGDVAFLTSMLVAIDITLAGLFWALMGEDNVLAQLIRKVLYVGFFALLLSNFKSLADIVFQSFAGLGLKAAARRSPPPI